MSVVSRAKVKDPVSGYLHAAGAALSVAGLVLLLAKARASGDSVWHFAGFTVFGIGLILLYCASSVYHLLNLKPNNYPHAKRGVFIGAL